MTKHIANRIEQIVMNGGFVLVSLKKLVDVLEDIRGVESINREFKEAFEDIEKRRGAITPSTKNSIFEYINSTEKYKYENNYDGMCKA